MRVQFGGCNQVIDLLVDGVGVNYQYLFVFGLFGVLVFLLMFYLQMDRIWKIFGKYQNGVEYVFGNGMVKDVVGVGDYDIVFDQGWKYQGIDFGVGGMNLL